MTACKVRCKLNASWTAEERKKKAAKHTQLHRTASRLAEAEGREPPPRPDVEVGGKPGKKERLLRDTLQGDAFALTAEEKVGIAQLYRNPAFKLAERYATSRVGAGEERLTVSRVARRRFVAVRDLGSAAAGRRARASLRRVPLEDIERLEKLAVQVQERLPKLNVWVAEYKKYRRQVKRSKLRGSTDPVQQPKIPEDLTIFDKDPTLADDEDED
ncbi:hypothetical protein TSOC_011656 [Tetrabaena socialis]|uniref:Uncharacterized protein n=1 Tax=Tetrabaena socialis TaxID=47790 RepID=A0A2J7ZQ32_9CHLO|nr:hypothetical protein TSOC_011656 [Tetrabaena socialis]|eukprot:PNH02373.1 hypothetical protein TSOC_011656 [Tetrabaena socialis]